MYAIIATGGKQYKVAEGDISVTEKQKKLSFTSTREKPAIIRKMVTDSSTQLLRSTRSTLNHSYDKGNHL